MTATTNTIHWKPVADTITHTTRRDCPCQPAVSTSRDGSITYINHRDPDERNHERNPKGGG